LGVVGTHTIQELHEADWIVLSLEGVVAKSGNGGLEIQFSAEKR
jgi:sugar-phosphatase